MKRKFFALLAALFLVLLAVPAAADASGSYVFDEAQLLDEQQEQQLNDLAAKYTKKYDCGLYIATVDNYRDSGSDVQDAAEKIYQEKNMGVGAQHDGILLLLSMSERDYALICHGGLANRIFDQTARGDIADSFLSYFGRNDWNNGFQAYLENSGKALSLENSGKALSGDHFKQGMLGIVVVLVGPAAVALIVVMTLKSKMKSVKIGAQARMYLLQGSEKWRVRDDIYTHTTEVRRRIEQPRSQSGGHGSSSSSGGFSGTSGKF